MGYCDNFQARNDADKGTESGRRKAGRDGAAVTSGNLSIIKNAICTNKFEWERAEGAAAAAVAAVAGGAAAAAVVEEQSIWLLNLTIRIYQWVAAAGEAGAAENCARAWREKL